MPLTGEAEQTEGTETDLGSQLGGSLPSRRCVIDTNEAKDHVRFAAEIGENGSLLRNCSAIMPFAGVYFCETETNESA